jgi:tetratricopeptide (TPR) repeat protein
LGYITVLEAESRNRPLIAKALELDSALAEAHAAQGEFKLFIEWDWAGAERAFKRALELNPNEPLSQLLYPDLLMLKGQTDEALAMEKKAFEMDPLSARTGKALAHLYYYAKKYDQALEQSKATLDLHPNYRMIFLGPIYEQKGMYDEAIKEYLKTEERWGLSQIHLVALLEAYAATGWRGYWQKRLDLLKSDAEHKPVSALRFAEVYVRLGDNDKTFEWLEKAYDNHEMGMVFLKPDPLWKPLHADPRFGSLLQRMSLSLK